MTKYAIILILLFSFKISFSQSKKAQKEIKKIIKSHELVYFKGGKFNLGFRSVFHGTLIPHKKDNINFAEMPSRRECESFLLCNHEVTVAEYVAFVLSISKKSKIEDVPIDFQYSFQLNNKSCTTSILPVIAYMGKKEKKYLTDTEFKNHPIIGISWIQAQAYIYWLNSSLAKELEKNSIPSKSLLFILPSHIQWEFASAQYPLSKKEKYYGTKYYPWLGQDLINENGTYKANFGQIETKYGVILKSYFDDGFLKTAPTKFYDSHFDLYDMAGNVSEWTSTHSTFDTLNFNNIGYIAHGGSFMSDPIFLQNGIYQIYPEEYQSNEVGFRIAMIIEENLITKMKLD